MERRVPLEGTHSRKTLTRFIGHTSSIGGPTEVFGQSWLSTSEMPSKKSDSCAAIVIVKITFRMDRIRVGWNAKFALAKRAGCERYLFIAGWSVLSSSPCFSTDLGAAVDG
jgi:hypothetical protein